MDSKEDCKCESLAEVVRILWVHSVRVQFVFGPRGRLRDSDKVVVGLMHIWNDDKGGMERDNEVRGAGWQMMVVETGWRVQTESW